MAAYSDDPTILDIDILWRRIPPIHFVHDQNLDRMRPTSAAFMDSPDGSPMSVFLAKIVQESGRSPDDALVGHTGYALSAVTAGLARERKQGVSRDPKPNEPAHALVFGKKTDAVRKAFAKKSEWVIPPPDRQTPQNPPTIFSP